MSKRPLGADESGVEAISEMETGEDSDVVPVPAEEEQPKTKPRRKTAASRVLSSYMREEQFKAEMKDSKIFSILLMAYNSLF